MLLELEWWDDKDKDNNNIITETIQQQGFRGFRVFRVFRVWGFRVTTTTPTATTAPPIYIRTNTVPPIYVLIWYPRWYPQYMY